MPANVCLRLEQVPLIERFEFVHLLVGTHDLPAEGLHHQQRLTQRARPLAQDVFWSQGDDGAEAKDKVVHIGGVQVESGHSIRHGVRGHVVRPLSREPQHVLRVHLSGVIAQLIARDGLEPLLSLR